jgi:histidinol-phosphatase
MARVSARHDDDLALALELADLADSITLSRYRAADLAVETKPDLTPVTEADRATEEALRERLASVRPADGVVGEEFGETAGGGGGGDARADEAAARRWVLDPIDGTKSYVRGLDTWATLIALMEGDEVVVGVASMPALGRRWWAVRGGGAFAGGAFPGGGVALSGEAVNGGRRIGVSQVRSLGDAQMAWSGIEDWDAVGRGEEVIALARACWRTRGVGDIWQYMLVAEGVAEIAMDPAVALWDMAAPMIIIEEAGGRFTSLAGARTPDGGSGIATNGLVHDAALAIVGER